MRHPSHGRAAIGPDYVRYHVAHGHRPQGPCETRRRKSGMRNLSELMALEKAFPGLGREAIDRRDSRSHASRGRKHVARCRQPLERLSVLVCVNTGRRAPKDQSHAEGLTEAGGRRLRTMGGFSSVTVQRLFSKVPCESLMATDSGTE